MCAVGGCGDDGVEGRLGKKDWAEMQILAREEGPCIPAAIGFGEGDSAD